VNAYVALAIKDGSVVERKEDGMYINLFRCYYDVTMRLKYAYILPVIYSLYFFIGPVFSGLVIVVNFIVDIGYAILDPRLRGR